MTCEFPSLTKGIACVRPGCGFTLPRDCDKAPIVSCRGRQMLGEWIKSELDKRGLTQEWYKERKSELGLPAECACDFRVKFLNWLDTTVSRAIGAG